MYKKILVALDGSRLSEGILPCADFFARTLKVPVELLLVIDSETFMPSTVKHAHYHDIIAAEQKKRGDYLKEVAISFSDALTVDCTVEVGKPAEVIVYRAAADNGTLIAMATHGRSGVKRWLLGSVADKVLHAASNHLLLVRTTEGTKSIEAVSLKSVLLPLDGSGLAESYMERLMDGRMKPEEVAILKRLSHGPMEYMHGTMTAAVSQELLARGVKIMPGEAIQMVITDASATDPSLKARALGFLDLPHTYDRKKYREIFLEALREIDVDGVLEMRI